MFILTPKYSFRIWLLSVLVEISEPASKLSYLGERSSSRENAQASGKATRGRGQRAEGPSLACSREALPNRRACSQARDFCESTARDDCICQYWFPKVVLLKFMCLPYDSLLVYPCDQILEPLTDAIPRPC